MGRYVFTPAIFDAPRTRASPGVGGEIQLTDAIVACCSSDEPCTATRSTDGRYDTARSSTTCGPRSSWRCEREDLGPGVPRRSSPTSPKREGLDVIPARGGPGLRPRPSCARAIADGTAAARRLGMRVRRCRSTHAEDVPPFAQHGDGRLRRAGRRHSGASAATPVRLEVAGHARRRRPHPTIAVGGGRGRADHDRRADARGRRRGRDGRGDGSRRRRHCSSSGRRSRPATHVRAAGSDVTQATECSSRRR